MTHPRARFLAAWRGQGEAEPEVRTMDRPYPRRRCLECGARRTAGMLISIEGAEWALCRSCTAALFAPALADGVAPPLADGAAPQ